MIRREPYQDPEHDNRVTLDVDPDDEVHYVGDVTQWLADSGTTAASFVPVVLGATVLGQDVPQGPMGGLLPVKLKVTFDGADDAHCTFRTTTADGQKFDRTMWFKQVTN